MKKIIMVIILSIFIFSCGTKLDDFTKSFESNTIGLKREVRVYSLKGDLLSKYTGESVRISENNEPLSVSILIDGKRMVFYNATIIVEEK